MRFEIEPVEHERGRWWVKSRTRKDVVYIVDADWEGGWGCACEQFMVRERECAHIRAVKARVDSGELVSGE